MNRIVIALGMLASTLAGKEALAQPVIPSEPSQITIPAAPYGEDGRYYQGNPAYDRQGYPGRRNGWSFIAATPVDGRRDRDIISVGPQAGRFDRLMLVPQGGRVRLHYVVVRFANGESITQDLRGNRGPAGPNASLVIDVPGNRRVDSVEIFSGAGRWGGAQVALYGERNGRRPYRPYSGVYR